MSAPQPTEPAPATDNSASEAELYAASTAENALPSDKRLPDEVTDLSALSSAFDAAALSDDEKKGQAEPASEQKSVAESTTTTTEEPERTLTKEEMVEEALNCPCIAAMKDGPCGDTFVAAYRCFLESETEPQGMDCMQQFTGMQSCMAAHPEAYPDDDDDDPFAVSDDKKADLDQTQEKTQGSVVVSEKESSLPPPTAAASS